MNTIHLQYKCILLVGKCKCIWLPDNIILKIKLKIHALKVPDL